MNAIALGTLLGMSACIAPSLVVERFHSPAPQVLTGNVTLPGKTPWSASDLTLRGWESTYLEPHARIEPGKPGALRTRLHLWFTENDRYQFSYAARWSPGNAENPFADPQANAVEAIEVGKFSLSGEILLLEPTRTELTEKVKGAVVAQEIIDNERRAYLAGIEHTRLHIAGRCAAYQVEPVCSEGRDVWYQLSAVGGGRDAPGRRRDSAPRRSNE